MKRVFFFVFAFLVFNQIVEAAVKGPIPGYFHWSKAVCIARVTAIDGANITFTVSDSLRGKSVDVLHLTAAYVSFFKIGTEWLLVSINDETTNPLKNVVGWEMEGYDGWLPTPVFRDGTTIYVQDSADENGQRIHDTASDGRTGLTLDHVKRLLEQNPCNP